MQSGLSLLLPPPKGGSGAALQIRTSYLPHNLQLFTHPLLTTPSVIGVFEKLALCAAKPSLREGLGGLLMIIQRQTLCLPVFPSFAALRMTVYQWSFKGNPLFWNSIQLRYSGATRCSSIVMQESTGQTSSHKLHPTHSSSLMV